MDGGPVRAYVGRVNLLLLLSALLSALTGANAGVRAPQARVAVAQIAERSVAARTAPTSIAGRPLLALPGLGTIAQAIPRPIWRLVAPVPPFASRRRE